MMRMDANSNLHPFLAQRLDAGPIRLTTIVHAFNYRVAVSAVPGGRKGAFWRIRTFRGVIKLLSCFR